MKNLLSRFNSFPEDFFGWLFWNLLMGIFPFGLFLAIASATGCGVVVINGEQRIGFSGFLYTLFIIPLFTLILSSMLWLVIFVGHLLINRIAPKDFTEHSDTLD